MRLLIFCMAVLLPFALAGQVSSAIVKSSSINYVLEDVIITEIMADPDPPNGLPVKEYVEIFNRSNDTVNLNGWVFYDGSSRILQNNIMNPHDYIIICALSDSALFSVYGKVAVVSALSITNTGEKLSLRNPSGQPVDSVTFSDTWYQGTYKKDGGWSLERIDNFFNCPVSANWGSSENSLGGTPGFINSISGICSFGHIVRIHYQ